MAATHWKTILEASHLWEQVLWMMDPLCISAFNPMPQTHRDPKLEALNHLRPKPSTHLNPKP